MASVEVVAYTKTQEQIEDFQSRHLAVSLEKKELPFRNHLGLSGIGNECARAVWLDFHWATRPTFPSNVVRLFNRGHREEEVFVEYLRSVGVQVQEIHPETGKQFKCNYADGHVGGSTDGFGFGFEEYPNEWVLLEFKTHSLKSFEDLIKKGVQRSKIKHYAQVQSYMRSFNLKACYYMAVCKNDDRLYTEWVLLDEAYAAEKIKLAEELVWMEQPPERIALSSTDYRCRFCDHRPVCWNRAGAEPDRNCRTCEHSYPSKTGTWGCSYNNVEADLDCFNPCSAYSKLGVFIKPVDITMTLTLEK